MFFLGLIESFLQNLPQQEAIIQDDPVSRKSPIIFVLIAISAWFLFEMLILHNLKTVSFIYRMSQNYK